MVVWRALGLVAAFCVSGASSGCGGDPAGDPDSGDAGSTADTGSASDPSASSSASGTSAGSTAGTSAGTASGTESTTGTTGTTTDPSDGTSGSSGGPIDGEPIEIRVPNFEIPTDQTFYACFEFNLQLDQLAHVVGFSPVIDNGAHVHHFVVTLLDNPTGAGPGYSCYDLNGDMIWAWAPGQTDFSLPPEAGYLIGNAPDGMVTVRLQVHYNNPQGVSGARDNSGFDMYVTDQLRPNSAGTLVFGDIVGISIPPGLPDYEHIMTCRGEVTQAQFDGPINVFATTMHAHEIGSVLYTEVWRDGSMAYELNRDDPYIFDLQHIKFVDQVIEPGDEVRNHCFYDSTERGGYTVGGPGTLDEMCWNTIMYYPRISNGFDYCSSAN